MNKKTIYDLAKALEKYPDRIAAAQKLTLDDSRPLLGLAGKYGLYGSEVWWANLRRGVLPMKMYEGRIESIQFSGMNNESKSFTVRMEDGTNYNYTCVANRASDLKLYEVGRYVRVVTFMETMKTGDEKEFVREIEIEID